MGTKVNVAVEDVTALIAVAATTGCTDGAAPPWMLPLKNISEPTKQAKNP